MENPAVNDSYFDKLSRVDISGKVESKKQGGAMVSYISWANAWKMLKIMYPDANYEIEKFGNGLPYVCDEATGYMVFTRVTVEGTTHEMCLPVLDSANRPLKNHDYTVETKSGNKINVKAATMFDINKSILRCLVKNIAMHGIGLSLYAGEDISSGDDSDNGLVPTDLVSEAQRLGMDLDRVAAYFKTSVQELTAGQISKAIEMQKKAFAKRKENGNA